MTTSTVVKEAVRTNAFAGFKKHPTEKSLAEALGETYRLWQRLVADLMSELNLDNAEWHTSSIKHGWAFRLQLKERNIVYLSPFDGYFVVTFVLGDRAVAAAKKIELPETILEIIRDARRYAEGTAVRIEVRETEDLAAVKTLARIKLEN